MKGSDLAQRVAETLTLCQAQIAKGQKDYYNPETDLQLFETMPLDKLFAYALEETADQVVYAVMQAIRIARLRQVAAEIQHGLETIILLARFLNGSQGKYIAIYHELNSIWTVRVNWRYVAQDASGLRALHNALEMCFEALEAKESAIPETDKLNDAPSNH